MKKIRAEDLVPLDDYAGKHPLRVDLVYAQGGHRDNIFRTAIYRPDARMWCHRELLPVILRAAGICRRETGYLFELKDCLRPIEAQARMLETDIVKANPIWTEEPQRLLSTPGKGGHPRGMAIDIILIDENGDEADMGTRFDYFPPNHRLSNPSGRAWKDFSPEILKNRAALEESMTRAAGELGLPLLPLPQEWWDFRFPYEYSSQFEPVSDASLPPDMRMT